MSDSPEKPDLARQVRIREISAKLHILLGAAVQLIPDLELLDELVNKTDEQIRTEVKQLSDETGRPFDLLLTRATNGKARGIVALQLIRTIKDTNDSSFTSEKKAAAVNESLKALGIDDL